MKKYKFFKIIFLLVTLVMFISCDTIIDCVRERKPNLISKELNSGTVFKAYNENLAFEMQNTNTKDYYISSVSIEGNLPPGINYSISNKNLINFKGAPTENGIYDFTVTITVKPYHKNEDKNDNLCQDSSSNKYRIIVDGEIIRS